jgi:hypothetical protein
VGDDVRQKTADAVSQQTVAGAIQVSCLKRNFSELFQFQMAINIKEVFKKLKVPACTVGLSLQS